MYHESILDNDLYKFTMLWAYLRKYPNVKGRSRFISRDDIEFPDGFAKELKKIVDSFRDIKLKKDEKDFFMEKSRYLPRAFFDFLEGYRYDPTEVGISQEGHRISVNPVGYLYRKTLWEVPLLATISELYFQMKGITPFPDAPAGSNITTLATEVNKKKAEALAAIGAFYSEFGTRRRYSSENQDKVIGDMKQYGKGNMLGTSNVYYAKKHNLMPMGTVAHEWYMMHAALFGYTMANQIASEAWVDVYEGNLGIALPDTFTTDVFLRTFSTKHAKLFDGLRQDSYDPIVFLEKIITHYKNLKINPTHKIGFFSDNLNSIEKVQRIRNATKDRIIDRYGFGTWMTNDLGVKPLNMVIKLMAVNNGGGWINTVKLSDDPMKNTGNRDTIDLCKQTLKIK